ncbi:MAG: hypothetical protein QXR81_08095 [Candidatus Nezhaarchaeales archaeon]
MEAEEGRGKVRDFKEVYKGELQSDGRLSALVDKTFVITNIEFIKFEKFGEGAVVTVHPDKRYHTFSAVLVKQLRSILDKLPVRATLRKRKRYYVLE